MIQFDYKQSARASAMEFVRATLDGLSVISLAFVIMFCVAMFSAAWLCTEAEINEFREILWEVFFGK